MQQTSTTEPPVRTQPAAVDTDKSRTFRRAFADIGAGLRTRQLWSHLGWQDIRQRYRRSTLGPLWITLSMGITAIGLGLLYSQLFGAPISAYVPYITAGFLTWNFIMSSLKEGSNTFIRNAGLVKHLPSPLTVYALRTTWRLSIIFLHNLVIYVIVIAVFFTSLNEPYKLVDNAKDVHPGLGWYSLLAIPALAIFLINSVWVVLLFGIISTRFRDVPQFIDSISSLLFFMTPIVWSVDTLAAKFGEGADTGPRTLIYQLNPMYHFLQIVRAPLIGGEQSWHHWWIVLSVTVIGWCLTLVVLRNYRARVSYWV
ncbi:ABC transporter permease [Haloechinothrix salitolerans]|uniref:ABC transporter permease n=1 Tax=Haloechinothrix salitolerans TaxID=926830 RepID=A0ABW2C8C5_9PSEU